MKHDQENVHRCLDNDLSDAEMKELFLTLGRSPARRKEFRALLQLRHELRSEPISVPSSLDERIQPVLRPPAATILPFPASIVRRRISFSLPAAAAALLLMLAMGYAAATSFAVPEQRNKYVYIVELPAYVVSGSHTQIVNN